MVGWPPEIAYALKEIGNQYPGDELSVEAFASCWGGLEHAHFVRAITEGQGEDDTLLGILALGYSDTLSNRELLASLLQSPYPKVRWVSAYCLGRMRDERALPVLHRAVKEFLPPDDQYVEYEGQVYRDWFYDDWRPRIARELSEWEES